jgi:hypothetical protein
MADSRIRAWHTSRLWVGNDRDRFGDECPCKDELCGAVTARADCPQHGFGAGKTLRRIHPEDACPYVQDAT